MFVFALFIASLLPIFSILFQIFVLLNPIIATITLVPISRDLSIKTEILAVPNPTSNEISSFLVKPVSFSQTKTVPATGHGHQNAEFARGTITFYNGSSTSRVIPEGTQLTGNDGVNVVTDNSVLIPPSSPTTPPTFGEASVSAHAIFTGPGGNIKAEDINSYSLGPSILAQNTYAFRGGMDARDFRIVTFSDIDNALNPLKQAASQSIKAKLLSEVKTGEKLFPPSCKTSISLDHRAGDEANSVKVTYVKTCTGIKYIEASLHKKGSDILETQAKKQLGENFSSAFSLHVQSIKRQNERSKSRCRSFNCINKWSLVLSNFSK